MSVYSVLKLRNDYTVFEELPTSVGDLTVVNAVLRGDAWRKKVYLRLSNSESTPATPQIQ